MFHSLWSCWCILSTQLAYSGISEGTWYLDYNNTGVIDKAFHFGQGGDIPAIGDWQGTGKDGIAIFRPSSGFWYFDYNLDGIVDTSFRYGGSTDQIITGDWQGTEKTGSLSSDLPPGSGISITTLTV